MPNLFPLGKAKRFGAKAESKSCVSSMATKPKKRAVKAKAVKRAVRTLKPKRSTKPKIDGKSGPRLDDSQRAMLLALLAAGDTGSAINSFFVGCGWGKLSASTLSHYRKLWASEIESARAARVDEALTSGMALRAERVAALKLHADQLHALRWSADRNGRLWNERAWRQTLDDIAAELGERRPQRGTDDGEIVKIYVGVDADKV